MHSESANKEFDNKMAAPFDWNAYSNIYIGGKEDTSDFHEPEAFRDFPGWLSDVGTSMFDSLESKPIKKEVQQPSPVEAEPPSSPSSFPKRRKRRYGDEGQQHSIGDGERRKKKPIGWMTLSPDVNVAAIQATSPYKMYYPSYSYNTEWLYSRDIMGQVCFSGCGFNTQPSPQQQFQQRKQHYSNLTTGHQQQVPQESTRVTNHAAARPTVHQVSSNAIPVSPGMKMMEKGQEADRPNILPRGKIGFQELATIIGKNWSNPPDSEKHPFHDGTSVDNERYHKEMEMWRKKHNNCHEPGSAPVFKDMSPSGSPSVSERSISKREGENLARQVDMPLFAPPRLSTAKIDKSRQPASWAPPVKPPFGRVPPSAPEVKMSTAQERTLQSWLTFSPDVNVAAIQENSPFQSYASCNNEWLYSRGNDFYGGGFNSQPFQQQQFHQHKQHYASSTIGYQEQLPQESTSATNYAAAMPIVHQVSPNAIPVSPGMEITLLPDQNGIEQKFKVQYVCYLVTKTEAKAYLQEFGDCPLRIGPPSASSTKAQQVRQVNVDAAVVLGRRGKRQLKHKGIPPSTVSP